MYPLELLDNSFNIYTNCPSNGTLLNTKTYMLDATECINYIGYALFAVIKAVLIKPNGLEMTLNYIF